MKCKGHTLAFTFLLTFVFFLATTKANSVKRSMSEQDWTPDLSGLNPSQLVQMINAGLAQKQRRSGPAGGPTQFETRAASAASALLNNYYSSYNPYGAAQANSDVLNLMNMGLLKRSYNYAAPSKRAYNLRSYKVGPSFNGKQKFSLPFTVFKRSEDGEESDSEEIQAPPAGL